MKLPQIKKRELLEEALTHRSYLNETKQKVSSNERLEFLGDSILSFIVSGYLFKNYPRYNEGKLTNLRSLLVNTRILAEVAKECGLGERLKLSKGEEESGGRKNQSLLADSFEAYIGALFLDQGVEATERFINQVLLPRAEAFIEKDMLKDPKSLLQEHVQSHKQTSPVYKVIAEKGPAHAKQFTVAVYVLDNIWGEGEGKSKQEAEEEAAAHALEKIKE